MMILRLNRALVLDSYHKSGLRLFATKPKIKEKKYSNTVLLPKTNFPQWLPPNKRVFVDQEILSRSGFKDLYSWQRENINGPEFILHDGPPYANGLPHMGHAINKVLKDIIKRQKLLSGHKIHYKLGWDCHGLPIEMKAVVGKKNIKPLEIRKKARKYAEQAIKDQKSVFKTWGLMADFDNECYYTYDKNYVKNQIHQFHELFSKGLIYRDMKPVYWSVSSNTALAEAELEYNHKHISQTIFLRLKLDNIPDNFCQYSNNLPVYVLVWTTTPWTLPANEAVAYNPNFEYSLVKYDGDFYIVGNKLIDHLQSKLGKILQVLTTFKGDALKDITYQHPLRNEIKKLYPASYVTDDVGTGLVHTAPSHGPDDYVLALQHQIPIISYVDEEGRYNQEAGIELENLQVLADGTTKVMDILKKDILLQEELVHSYPYDWRTKKPVLIRASKQWFIDTKSVKDRAIELVKKIKILPDKNVSSFLAQLEKRPYWCISRQRAWGVPIPVFYDENEKPVISKNSIEHFSKLIDQEGTDFWWSLDKSDLIPSGTFGYSDSNKLVKGKDILDIWFDSGLSWSAILDGKVADLYLEGIDQFTGWFQSSLLTSVALRDRAPFKTIISHGFSVDDQGRKMSKSLGNVVNPFEITHGGIGDKKVKNAYGVDILRWWVAAHALQHSNIPVSNSTLTNSFETVKKLRNNIKFLLGCINDFPSHQEHQELYKLDEYMLNKLYKFENQVVDLYESYEFNKITALILNFISNDISSFYCHHVKDRLYCDEANSSRRRAAQYTINEILNSLLYCFSPILPVLAEEVYSFHPHNVDGEFYFHNRWKRCTKRKYENSIDAVIESCMTLKEKIVKDKPLNVASSQISIKLVTSKDLFNCLNVLQEVETSSSSELVELLQVAEVNLIKSENVNNFEVYLKISDNHICERCRLCIATSPGSLCYRCSNVLKSFQ